MSATKTTTTTPTQRAPSSALWFAVMTNKENPGILEVLKSKTQKELKQKMHERQEWELHFVGRGKSFEFRVQKSFDFIPDATQTDLLNN